MTSVKVVSTRETGASQFVRFLIHGQPKVGKTRLALTVPRPLIINAENGTLSISDHDLAQIKVDTEQDVDNAIAYAARNVDKYDWLFVDSLSEIAEVILRKNLEEAKDPRQAYGATQDAVLDKVRRMRDMPGINVAIICQQADGRLSMPGQKLGPKIPYMFDEIFCVVSKGEGDDTQYFVQTEGDAKFLAGDRSGKLRRLEPMHLGGIAAKIRGEDAAEAKKKIDEKLAAQANKPAEQAKKESK